MNALSLVVALVLLALVGSSTAQQEDYISVEEMAKRVFKNVDSETVWRAGETQTIKFDASHVTPPNAAGATCSVTQDGRKHEESLGHYPLGDVPCVSGRITATLPADIKPGKYNVDIIVFRGAANDWNTLHSFVESAFFTVTN